MNPAHDCGSQLSHTAPASFSLEVNPQTQQYYANTECLYSLEKVDSEKVHNKHILVTIINSPHM